MKKKMVTALLAVSMLAGLSAVNVMAADDDTITVGFSQVGAESDLRTANTESMKSTFSEDNGYELIFDDAQQKQENQLTAIRNFIQQEVDYIVLAPVTETGWDTVLQEAKDAGIPVIIVDRMVDVSDDSLYTAWVGSNFKLEGQKAMAWLDAYLEAKGRGDEEINLVDIQGTIGASAQIGRTEGFDEAVEAHDNWTTLAQQSGEFTQAKGQEVMESILKQSGDDIDVVYCENDNEAFGAIDAIEAAGGNDADRWYGNASFTYSWSEPQDIIDNIDYIYHTHAKFYNVHEDYVETAVAIPEVIEAFKKAGYKGYLSSEYEGGEHLRDVGVDSIEQVRRHQEAMRRAIEG